MASSRRTFLKEAATVVTAGAIAGQARQRVALQPASAAGPASIEFSLGLA